MEIKSKADASPLVFGVDTVKTCLTVACAPSDAAECGYFAKRAQEICRKGLENSGFTCPAGVSVRFASLVDVRHSYYNARTTGLDFVLRSNGRWAKRTAHRLFLARQSTV